MLTRYSRLGASSRVRSLQYIPGFTKEGFEIDVSPLFSDEYLVALYRGGSRWGEVVFGYWARLQRLVGARPYDLIWIEKEIFPFLPAAVERLLGLLGTPYVVDYDDALFHRYDRHPSGLVRSLLGRKIDVVMRQAALVVAGNEYLAERARMAGARRVEIVPTVVDLDRYLQDRRPSTGPPVVGWIGTPATRKYLLGLRGVFESIRKETEVRIVAVGLTQEMLGDARIESVNWSEDTEVQSIKSFDIGIMPLPDEPWERGKCGYKLIQYMACGVPVVASPVGVNNEIVRHGENGFLAETEPEWLDAIKRLIVDAGTRKRMGKVGREMVEARFSLQVQLPRLEAMLRAVAG